MSQVGDTAAKMEATFLYPLAVFKAGLARSSKLMPEGERGIASTADHELELCSKSFDDDNTE